MNTAIALRADQVQPGMKMWSSLQSLSNDSTWREVVKVYPSQMMNVTVIEFEGMKVPYLSNSNVYAVKGE